MAAPAGFGDLMDRKYDIQQEQVQNAGKLQSAQADNITDSTASENELRDAQAQQANETAKTIGQLAEASIRASEAAAHEAYARSGLYGSQRAVNYDTLGQVPDIGLSGAYRTMQQTFAPKGAISSSPIGNGNTVNERSVLDGGPMGGLPGSMPSANNNVSQYTKGTSMVKPQKFATGTDNAQPGGINIVPGNQGTWDPRGAPIATPTTPAPAPLTTPPFDVRAATGRLGVMRKPAGYARGTSMVPSSATTTMAGKPPTSERAYAKGASKVPHGKSGAHGRGVMPPPMMSPQGPMGTPPGVPAPAQMASAMPGPMGPGGPPQGLPGLAGMLQAAMGASQVPGQGDRDSVPAMLTPGEAVVNKGAISHIPGGRDTIAKANAAGNADNGRLGLSRGMVKKPVGHRVAVHIHMG